MMDDETRKRFDAVDNTVAQLSDLVGRTFERLAENHAAVVARIDAIVVRLDEQDQSHDRLMGKVDRLSAKVDQLSILARAGEEAMTSLDALSRRVSKIEAALRGNDG